MNQRRSSARIFQIFLLSSALLCAMAHANDDRSALLESLLPLIRGLQQSNPFELEFDNGFELEDGSFRVWRHKYIQSGEMWREEIRDEKGELRLVTSFDGERYFWYDPVGINLHIAKDPEGPGASEIFHRSILSAFRNNPLTCWAFPFFWNWDSRSNGARLSRLVEDFVGRVFTPKMLEVFMPRLLEPAAAFRPSFDSSRLVSPRSIDDDSL